MHPLRDSKRQAHAQQTRTHLESVQKASPENLRKGPQRLPPDRLRGLHVDAVLALVPLQKRPVIKVSEEGFGVQAQAISVWGFDTRKKCLELRALPTPGSAHIAHEPSLETSLDGSAPIQRALLSRD